MFPLTPQPGLGWESKLLKTVLSTLFYMPLNQGGHTLNKMVNGNEKKKNQIDE